MALKEDNPGRTRGLKITVKKKDQMFPEGVLTGSDF
jgi:hypothetical protein